MTHMLLPEALINGLSSHVVAQCGLYIALVLGITLIIGKIGQRMFSIPAIAGQLGAGIILGPTLLNIRDWSFFHGSLSLPINGMVVEIASADLALFVIVFLASSMTVPFLLWLAGYETDLDDMFSLGPTALLAGVLGAIVPIFMVAGILLWLQVLPFSSALGMGLIFSATSVSIPVAMLVAQNKMGLRSSKATLGAAIIDDIVAVVLLSLFILGLTAGYFGLFEQQAEIASISIGWLLTKIGLGFVGFIAFGMTIMAWSMKFLNTRRLLWLIPAFAFCCMLLYSAFAELIAGLAGITGAYFAGLFQRRYDEHHASEQALSPFITAIFVPLFFASIGLQVNLRLLSFSSWLLVILLLLVAVLSKFMGVFGATWLSNRTVDKKRPWHIFETYLFGSSMVARGEVGLVVATLLRRIGILGEEMYIVAIVVITFTTLLTPLLLALGFSYEKKFKRHEQPVFKRISLGHFDVLGTKMIFEAMLQVLEAHEMVATVVMLEEGRYAINVEDKKIEIIYDPQEGIILFGEMDIIKQVVLLVKNNLQLDLKKFNI